MKEYDKILGEFLSKHDVKLVYLTKTGSKLYGTDHKSSDTDYKGVFIPSVRSLITKTDIEHYNYTTGDDLVANGADDIDIELYSIHKFINMLAKSDTNAVDLLFSMWRSDTIEFQDRLFTMHMKENYKGFLNTQMKAFTGYALGQAMRFGIKGRRYNELVEFLEVVDHLDFEDNDLLQTLFDTVDISKYKYINMVDAPGPRGSGDYKDIPYISVLGKMFEGRVTVGYFNPRVKRLKNQFGNRTKAISDTKSKSDFKALSHALRISLEVQELLKTGFIKFPLEYADEIKQVKLGNVPTEDVIQNVQEALFAVGPLSDASNIQEKCSKGFLSEMLIWNVEAKLSGYIPEGVVYNNKDIIKRS